MTEFVPSTVIKNLYISGILGVVQTNVDERNIKLIINLTYNTPPNVLKGVLTEKIEIDDLDTVKISNYFDSCNGLIDEYLSRGEGVLVHCMAGVSRSATICLAYLIKQRNMTLHDAYKHLKKCRPIIRPNHGFFSQLIDYELKVTGTTTVKMVKSSIGRIPELYMMQQDSGLGYFIQIENNNKNRKTENKSKSLEVAPMEGSNNQASNITMPPGPQQKVIPSSNSPNKVLKPHAFRVPSPLLQAIAQDNDCSSSSETIIQTPSLALPFIPSCLADSGIDADDEMSFMSIRKTYQ